LNSDYGVDFDRNADILGPFGTAKPETVAIQKGKCFKDSAYFNYD